MLEKLDWYARQTMELIYGGDPDFMRFIAIFRIPSHPLKIIEHKGYTIEDAKQLLWEFGTLSDRTNFVESKSWCYYF